MDSDQETWLKESEAVANENATYEDEDLKTAFDDIVQDVGQMTLSYQKLKRINAACKEDERLLAEAEEHLSISRKKFNEYLANIFSLDNKVEEMKNSLVKTEEKRKTDNPEVYSEATVLSGQVASNLAFEECTYDGFSLPELEEELKKIRDELKKYRELIKADGVKENELIKRIRFLKNVPKKKKKKSNNKKH